MFSLKPVSYASGNPKVILFALWLLVFAASSQIMIIAPILPRISEALSIGESLLGTLVTAYASMVGLFALIIGPISDKIGRRKVLLLGAGGMAIALYLHGFATTYTSLLFVRAASGVAGGMLSGAAVSYVGDYFPYEKRGWANGWVMSGIAMGQIVGIPIGTILAEYFDYTAPFLSFAVIMTAAYVLIYLQVPQPQVTLDANQLTIKSSLIKYGLLMKQKPVIASAVSYLLMFFSISVYITFFPTWLERTFEVNGNQIASMFLVGGIANVLTGPNAGKLSDLYGRKRIILIACIGFSLIMIVTTLVISSFWLAYPVFFLIMVLVAMRISPFQALLTELVPSHQRGILMSLMVAIGQVGFGLGGAIAGPAFDMNFFVNCAIGSGTIFIMALIVWRFVPEPQLKQ